MLSIAVTWICVLLRSDQAFSNLESRSPGDAIASIAHAKKAAGKLKQNAARAKKERLQAVPELGTRCAYQDPGEAVISDSQPPPQKLECALIVICRHLCRDMRSALEETLRSTDCSPLEQVSS